MTSSKLTKCLFNDRGYCKYREQCRKQHHKSICPIKNCDKKCNARHPKPCKFKSECRFNAKNICAFKHNTIGREDDELDALKNEIESLKSENQRKELELERLENENQEFKEKVDDDKEGNFRQKVEYLGNTNESLKAKVIKLEINHVNEKVLLMKDFEAKQAVTVLKFEKELAYYKSQVDSLNDKVTVIQNINDHYKDEIKISNTENAKVKEELVKSNYVLKSQNVEIQKFKAELKCGKCEFIAKDLSNLVLHMTNGKHVDQSKHLSCTDCDFTCETDSHLKMHKSFKHAVKIENFKFT